MNILQCSEYNGDFTTRNPIGAADLAEGLKRNTKYYGMVFRLTLDPAATLLSSGETRTLAKLRTCRIVFQQKLIII